MSSIPDIREPYVRPLYPNTKIGKQMTENPEDNVYYQGNLDEESAHYLAGYDYAIEQVFTNFFYNLNVYIDDFEECGFDDQRLSSFSRHFQEFMSEENTEPFNLDTIKDTQIRLILTIIRSFWQWAEMERDEIGTSLIESMSDEELAECQTKYKSGYKNYLLRLEEAKRKGEIFGFGD